MTHSTHASSGLNILAPRSKFYQGPYGRLYADLPPWSPMDIPEDKIDDHFWDIANQEMIEVPGKSPTEIAQDPGLVRDLERRFNSRIPAGYTYFGQFVDHDITFDPASSLMRQNDPNGLLNHRTPRLDLDNLYGAGPEASPYLYDQRDHDKFLIEPIGNSKFKDLPRNRQGRALIGDPRNDENAMISQLQTAFLMAHNELVDRARSMGIKPAFERARTTLRWLYQHVVWHDFVRRIASDEVYRSALTLDTTPDGRQVWNLGLKDVYRWKNQPYMPVEFSVAAYRFGHSMVRNAYRTNVRRGLNKFVPIFDHSQTPHPDDLRGFRPMRVENVIQWDLFLPMTSSTSGFPQMARKIDAKLSNALFRLHAVPGHKSPLNVLAFRNLMRGWRFGLPSGSDIAKKYGLKPVAGMTQDHDALWYYLLKEAESLPGNNAGQMLGRIGSIIVCATFAGLLKGDPQSILNIDPNWTPDQDPLLRPEDNKDPGNWTLAAIIRLSGLPAQAGDF